MNPQTFAHLIESDTNDYQGTMEAEPVEVAPPGVLVTRHIIRKDQAWSVRVDWEVHGSLVTWLDAEFRLRAYLESMGPGTEYVLPAAPVVIPTLSVPVAPVGGLPTRTYTTNINVNAAQVDEGIYKLVTVLQLFERSTGNPTPVAGFAEGPMIQIFQPA